MKTLLAYFSFLFNYGFKLSLKIIFYELKFINYYKDNTSKYIPNNKLNVKNYGINKITGYSPAYYYYLTQVKLFFKDKNISFDNIYDIGFGTGRVLYFCKFFAKNLYGFEVSKKIFDIGKKKLEKEIGSSKNLELYLANALEFTNFKNNSLIFIFDPFTKPEDIEILLNNLSNLKNSYLVYANPRFREKVKYRFNEIFRDKSHNFRGLSIFKI